MSIVYRQELGRELTWSEADNNFAELKAGVDSKKSNFDVLPVTQGGTGQTSVDAVKIAFDIATKTELASSAAGKGAELVEYQGATVEAALDERLPEIGTYALLRAYTGPVTAVLVRGVANIFDGGAGVFRVDAGDTTSADNGGTILVDSAGRRWKREYAGAVNVRWFGAKGDGIADDTAKIQAAANAASGGALLFSPGTYLITSAVTLDSNTDVRFEGSVLQSHTTTISLLSATSKTNVRVYGARLKYTESGTTPYIAGVLLSGCSYCVVEDCRFEGMQWAGVYLRNSTYCTVTNNRFVSGYGSAQDAADISVHENSRYNLIQNNTCTGGALVDHGILVQDPSGATIPYRNIVQGNHVGEHKAYGIALYMVQAADMETLVDGNYIEDIIGTALSGKAGMGIYVQSAGGSVISNNTVRNCNRSTSSETHGPGAISLSFDLTTGLNRTPCVVSGNNIDTAKYAAIHCSGVRASITGNRARSTDTINGRGIFVSDCIDTQVTGNSVEVPASAARNGIQITSTVRSLTGITVSGNTVKGGNGVLLYLNPANTYTVTASVSGNNCAGSGENAQALNVTRGLDCSVNGNYLSGALVGLFIDSCTGTRGAGNVCRSSTFTFLGGGTNADNFFDSSNDFDTNTARISNSNAGTNLEVRRNAAPTGGNWQIGDRTIQSTPVVGNPKGWVCTAAGAPGTWVSEGNL